MACPESKLSSENINSFYIVLLYPLNVRSVHRKASVYTDITTQKKHVHTSMPRAEFEPTIPVFERSNTVCVLDHAATWT
jgi:hypothetical protein